MSIGIGSGDTKAEEFLELPNGCLCCSIKDTGAAAIEELMKRKGAFDHILLETTGLADPGPIAQIFWQNEEYGKGLGWDITLDGVVCVVDAVYGLKQIEEDHSITEGTSGGIGESLRQIAGADVVLLNKVDVAPPDRVQATEDTLFQINPALTVHRTVRGEVDLASVLSIRAYASGPPIQSEHVHGEHCGHAHEPAAGAVEHYTVRGIASLQVACPTLSAAKLSQLDAWLRALLWDARLPPPHAHVEGLEVLRCKGLVRTDDGRVRVLQGVREMYELEEIEVGREDNGKGAQTEGKLVFIGKGLGVEVKESLEAVLFEAAFVK